MFGWIPTKREILLESDPTPNKILCGKRDDKTNSRLVMTIWDGSHPEENYEWEEEQPSWTTNYFKLVPHTPPTTTTPTFSWPDGFAAGKKGNKGSHPQFHARTVVLFFRFLEVTAAPVITSNLYGETRYLCKRYFFLISRRLPWFVITGNWRADQPSHFIQGCLLFALFSGHARPAKKQLAAARTFE